MLDPDARRLVAAAALRLHLARTLGTDPLPADLDADGLRALAERLRPHDDTLRRAYGLRFEPDYPGAAVGAGDGVEEVRGGRRLVLMCTAWRAGEPAGVVVTTLVPGRAPQVSAAPPALSPGGSPGGSPDPDG